MVACRGMETRPNPGDSPALVAHRGDAEHFPENTVDAIRGAINCGLRFIEIDVQLTADRVPVLLHDSSLQRTAGVDRLVSASIASEVIGLPVSSDAGNACLPSLAEALAVATPDTHLFVELKRHSLRAFGRRRMLEAVLPVLATASCRVTIISFDYRVLELVDDYPVGWVLLAYNIYTRRDAVALSPQYLFCNHLRLPGGGLPLWPGSWQWVVYEVTDSMQAARLHRRGADMVESMAACRLAGEQG